METDKEYIERIKKIDNCRDILKEIIEMDNNGWVCTDGYYRDITEPIMNRAREILLDK